MAARYISPSAAVRFHSVSPYSAIRSFRHTSTEIFLRCLGMQGFLCRQALFDGGVRQIHRKHQKIPIQILYQNDIIMISLLYI